MSKHTNNEFRLLPVAAAILLAFGNAYAEEIPDVRELIMPQSSISAGVGLMNGGADAKRFSEYTGLTQNASLLLDFELNKRDDASGLWTTISAHNLGLDTREFGIAKQRQGNWKMAVDYNEITRRDPYIINTGMLAIGSKTPIVNLIATPAMTPAWATANGLAASNGVAGSDVELQLKRTAVGISGDTWITPELQVELSFRNEDKKGARMFGRAGLASGDMQFNPTRGTGSANGSWAVLLTPEPVNSSTKIIEGKLNFHRDKLALSGGYSGSFYINNNGSMSPIVPSALNRGALWNGCATAGACSTVQGLASSSVALPPDNQAHQFFLSGNYAFSDSTRSHFKVSYTLATQNENFLASGLSPTVTAPADLGGAVDTTLVQFGLAMRPLKDLSVNASARYENRNDNTPVYVYNTNGIANSPLNGTTNWPSASQTRSSTRIEGIYRLPFGYSVTLGGDLERKSTPLPLANVALFNKQVFFRPVLNETAVHAEVRKALSETLNGALGVEYRQRRGNDGDWVTASGLAGNPLVAFDPSLAASAYIPAAGTRPAVAAVGGGNAVLPDMYMDRNRSKLRGNLDWETTDSLSLQAVAEHAQDDFLRATPATPFQGVSVVAGARTIISDSVSLDSTYLVSDSWKVNGFWTHSYNRWNVNKINIGDDSINTADTFGIGINGKPSARLTIGLDILSTRDKTTFNNVIAYAATSGTNPANLADANGNIAGYSTAMPGNYLPTIYYKTDKLNLRGKYALDKISDVVVNLSYQQFQADDWQWAYNGTPFVYSDNTTVSQPSKQTLQFISASYIVRF